MTPVSMSDCTYMIDFQVISIDPLSVGVTNQNDAFTLLI
jgi:hypothetical protein